jgi:hypothetical protein
VRICWDDVLGLIDLVITNLLRHILQCQDPEGTLSSENPSSMHDRWKDLGQASQQTNNPPIIRQIINLASTRNNGRRSELYDFVE